MARILAALLVAIPLAACAGLPGSTGAVPASVASSRADGTLSPGIAKPNSGGTWVVSAAETEAERRALAEDTPYGVAGVSYP